MAEGLIIDDNRQTADALNQMLAVLGFKARVAYGSSPAMDIVGERVYTEVYLSRYQHARRGWTEILAYLRREPRLMPVPVFVITSDDQPETRTKVMKLGATAMLIKPATIDAMETAFKTAKMLK